MDTDKAFMQQAVETDLMGSQKKKKKISLGECA